MRLIDGEKLYNELLDVEDKAIQRQLDTPSTINGALSPMYIRYSAQANQITSMRLRVADAPTVHAIPMDRIKQLMEEVDTIDINRVAMEYEDMFYGFQQECLALIDNMIAEYEDGEIQKLAYADQETMMPAT